jgi:epoxyqueuosine reductase QueG
MDATRCLSYLTIELRGAIPQPAREDVGHHVYGCDICQDVCPWNLTPSTGVSSDKAWLPRARDEAGGGDAPAPQPRRRAWQQWHAGCC